MNARSLPLPLLLVALLAAGCATEAPSPSGGSGGAATPPEAGLVREAAPGVTELSEGIEVVPGLRYRALRRGAVAGAERFRVVMGSFAGQRETDGIFDRLGELGLDGTVLHRQERYRVAVAEIPDAESAAALRERLLAEGFPEPLEVEPYGQDDSHREGPWEIHVLEADPRRLRVEVAAAADAVVGLETTRGLAARRGAVAAINGGYFRTAGTYLGEALGVLQLDGRLLSEPDRGRGAVGLWEQEGVTRAVFGRLGFQGEVELGDVSLPLSGINRPRGSGEVILYTPELHTSTLTADGGLELVVVGDRVLELRSPDGDTPIPRDGFVISLGPEAVARQATGLEAGTEVALRASLLPLLPDPDGAWEAAQWILGGGPLLVFDGERVEDHQEEAISQVFFQARHPRTAVGVREDGTLLGVVVDGRRPERSVGMSLPELTDLMLELGAVAALNLDGGGSSTMVVDGQVVNLPSDLIGERANADALLLFPRPLAPHAPEGG